MKTLCAICMFTVSAAVCCADYVDQVLADGPLAYYRFEESAGASRLTDSSGNGNDSLVLSNVQFNVAGAVGHAGRFNGDGYIVLDFNRSPAAGDFSIECLVQLTGSSPHFLVSQLNGSGTGRLLLLLDNNGMARTRVGSIPTGNDEVMSIQQWHHLVVAVDVREGDDMVLLYVDGTLVGREFVDAEAADGTWILGSHKSLVEGLDGLLDEVAVYPVCLNGLRILEHFIQVRGLKTKHFVASGGTAVAPYATWETAAAHVQDALAVAESNSVIWIGDGTFTETSPLCVSNAITLQSLHGPFETFIRPQDPDAEFEMNFSGGCTLLGLTIGGTAADGTGPLVDGSVFIDQARVENCIFQNVHAPDDSGFDCCNAILRNCIVRNMECYYNSTINDCTVDYSLFSSMLNTYPVSIVGCIRSSRSLYRNCAFVDVVSPGESDARTGIIAQVGRSTFSNCTFNMDFPVGVEGESSVSCVNCYSNDAEGMIDAGIVINPFDLDIRGAPRFLNGELTGLPTPDIGPYEIANSALDSDLDGLPDDLEVEMGLNPLVDELKQQEGWVNKGISRGTAEVLADPHSFGMYTANDVADLEMGRMTLQSSNRTGRLSVRMRQRAGGSWTNAGDAVNWDIDTTNSKAFYRVRGRE